MMKISIYTLSYNRIESNGVAIVRTFSLPERPDRYMHGHRPPAGHTHDGGQETHRLLRTRQAAH